MCGICGYMSGDASGLPRREVLDQMCEVLVDRGPDEAGIYMSPGIGLGHRRLKIIDLETGCQPMTDASGRYTIVFNGEIYNFQELRKGLISAGYKFVTQSDTEVLLYGIIHEDLDFLQRVNGMFAFGLWDEREKELLLVRDRLGVKPLYWAEYGNGVVFASEASAIAASGLVDCEIDQSSLAMYLSLSYIPGQNSIYTKVKRLLPGSWLRCSCGSGLSYGEWWNLSQTWRESLNNAHSVNDWEEMFTETLVDAVRLRLKSDVPLGAFLSSGIDSSTIAAITKQYSPNVNTFTMAFAEASHNEAPQAAETAKALGLNHLEELADLGAADNLIDIASRLDEPFADTSLIPMHVLCKMAKKHVSVALTGDGADELLGGYITNQADEVYAKLRSLPVPLVSLMAKMVKLLPDNHKKINFIFKLKQFFAAFPRSEAEAHACWRLLFYPEALKRFFPEDTRLPDVFAPFNTAWDESAGLPLLDRFLYVDYKTWQVDDIFVKADRASMRHGLELRAPFLDYRLFSLCAGMPSRYKYQGNKGKIILRKTAAKLLPSFVLNRPKRGFNAPVAHWLCNEWRELGKQEFTRENIESRGLNPEPVLRLWNEHLNYKRNHGFQLFNILVYLLWSKGLTRLV